MNHSTGPVSPKWDARWAAIPGLPETFATPEGRIYSTRRGGLKEMTAFPNDAGYLRVRVWGKHRSVHRLVAMAFLGDIGEGLEVNHKNGDKSDNRPVNLEYVTRSANVAHAFRTGLKRAKRGETHPKANISDETIAAIAADYRALVRPSGRLPHGAEKQLCLKYGIKPDVARRAALGLIRPAAGK